MDNQDWPITGVLIVADVSKCPPGYTTIDKTYDRQDDADLWRDGIFGRRVYRYMCVERCAPQPGKDVLVDVSVINEKDPIPPGFTVVDYTNDTREKAIRKKTMCVRWMNANLTNSAISELIILAKGTKRPPNGYTMVGELNSLMLCYKMANIRTQPQDNTMNMSNLSQNLPYALNPTQQSPQQPPAQQAYSPSQQYSPAHTYNHHVGSGTRVGPPERSYSTLGSKIATPLSGVPWQLNPKFQELSNLKNIKIPEIRYKSIMDIEQQYDYNFATERTARARIPNDLH